MHDFASQCSHRGEPVKAGPYTVYVGGDRYLTPSDLKKADYIIPLSGHITMNIGQYVRVIGCPWPDMQPPPLGFQRMLEKIVIPVLEKDKKVLFYCMGGHGRTGTFLASLIALLEPEVKNPIAAARERHCEKAVETLAQARFVYSLRGKELPRHWSNWFTPKVSKCMPTGPMNMEGIDNYVDAYLRNTGRLPYHIE